MAMLHAAWLMVNTGISYPLPPTEKQYDGCIMALILSAMKCLPPGKEDSGEDGVLLLMRISSLLYPEW